MKRFIIILLFLITFVLPIKIYAAEPIAGSVSGNSQVFITGRVLDNDRPAVDVEVIIELNGRNAQARTNNDGVFVYSDRTAEEWGITIARVYDVIITANINGRLERKIIPFDFNPTDTAPGSPPEIPTAEEQAAYNQCELRSAQGVCPTPKPNRSLWASFINLFTKGYWLGQPNNPDRLDDQGQTLKGMTVPINLVETQTNNFKSVEDSFGVPTGIYGQDLPRETIDTNFQIKDYECATVRAKMPPGVDPITKQSNSRCWSGQ